MITLEEIIHDNVGKAMELVTESYEYESLIGARSDDYMDDWEAARSNILQVVDGYPYVGMLAVSGRTPVGLSLIRASAAYGPGVGVWDWFYVTQHTGLDRGRGIGLKLARVSAEHAIGQGCQEFVAFIGMLNSRLQHTMEKMGMVPVEIELRGQVSNMRKGLVSHGHRNGRSHSRGG